MNRNIRVFKDDKFVVIKIIDNLTQDKIFVGKANINDKKALKDLFLDAEAKGFNIR